MVALFIISGLYKKGESGGGECPLSCTGVKCKECILYQELDARLGWSSVTPGSLPHQAAHLNRIVEDQRIYLGSVIIITQHHLNVLSRDIGNNKGYIYLYIFIYLSNLRAKDLEYNSSSQKRSISKKGNKMDSLLHKIWLKWSWFLQLLL